MQSAANVMYQGLTEGVFPGAVLLVARYDEILFHSGFGLTDDVNSTPVTEYTIYDLASLTKPLATAPAIMLLVQEGVISVNDRLSDIIGAFGGTDKADIRLWHLLCHNAGLPDYRPYYLELRNLPEQERKSALRSRLLSEPRLYPAGSRTLYSDLGFMILEWVVEMAGTRPLDAYVTDTVYQPLAIEDLFFLPRAAGGLAVRQIAATERMGADTLLRGRVHDENADAVGGVSGHAGLFGTAEAVYRLLLELLRTYAGGEDGCLFVSQVVRQFLTIPVGAERAMGFDVPSKTGASCGRHFTRDKTVGHLGFTGTSFWMDLERGIIVVLLSNRVCPSRSNDQIKAFRPRLHDVIMRAVGA